jgi:hypothetical protein
VLQPAFDCALLSGFGVIATLVAAEPHRAGRAAPAPLARSNRRTGPADLRDIKPIDISGRDAGQEGHWSAKLDRNGFRFAPCLGGRRRSAFRHIVAILPDKPAPFAAEPQDGEITGPNGSTLSRDGAVFEMGEPLSRRHHRTGSLSFGSGQHYVDVVAAALPRPSCSAAHLSKLRYFHAENPCDVDACHPARPYVKNRPRNPVIR